MLNFSAKSIEGNRFLLTVAVRFEISEMKIQRLSAIQFHSPDCIKEDFFEKRELQTASNGSK